MGRITGQLAAAGAVDTLRQLAGECQQFASDSNDKPPPAWAASVDEIDNYFRKEPRRV